MWLKFSSKVSIVDILRMWNPHDDGSPPLKLTHIDIILRCQSTQDCQEQRGWCSPARSLQRTVGEQWGARFVHAPWRSGKVALTVSLAPLHVTSRLWPALDKSEPAPGFARYCSPTQDLSACLAHGCPQTAIPSRSRTAQWAVRCAGRSRGGSPSTGLGPGELRSPAQDMAGTTVAEVAARWR